MSDEIVLTERWVFETWADIALRIDRLNERLVEQLTGFHVHRGALASLTRTPLPTVDKHRDRR